ncbi:hypothetical protein AB6A40_006266 [Gnathostoma spinigerum]|uniref:Uncharacterized protein n=1 Tax=Gnathostoma spinigerum TaxID=75299 RepID=A0ABD6EK41_9BILA
MRHLSFVDAAVECVLRILKSPVDSNVAALAGEKEREILKETTESVLSFNPTEIVTSTPIMPAKCLDVLSARANVAPSKKNKESKQKTKKRSTSGRKGHKKN